MSSDPTSSPRQRRTQPLLRPIIPDDVPAIALIEVEAFGAHGYSAEAIRQLIDLGPRLSRAALDDGAMAGYVFGAIADDARTGWVLALAVKTAARGHGLGSALLDACLASLDEMQLDRVLLTVHPANALAVKLYERRGFVTARTDDAYFGEGEPRLVMERLI